MLIFYLTCFKSIVARQVPRKTASCKHILVLLLNRNIFPIVSPVVPDVVTTPDYPDDFEEVSSDEAEYSDDFDDAEGDESLKQPMAAKTTGVLRKVDSYSDEEFEEDSDEVLGD